MTTPAEVPQSWTISLPFSEPPLTANQRLHWRERAKLTKLIRHATGHHAKSAGIPPQEHIVVSLHYQPGDNRRRDADNLVPTLKACCDGLVDARIVPDDTPQYMAKLMPEIHPGNGERRLWLTVRAAQEHDGSADRGF